MTSLALLERGAALSATGEFLQSGSTIVTYRDAVSLVRRIANALNRDGFGIGANAAVLSANDPTAFLAALGVHASGMALVPLNPGAPAVALASVINQFECRVLFYHEDLAAIVREMKPVLGGAIRLVCLGACEGDDVSLDVLLEGVGAGRPSTTAAGEDIGYIGQTGGTTGEPKGVMISWRAVNAFVTKFLTEIRDPAPVLLAATPLTHAAGMLALPIMAAGGKIIVMKRPDPVHFLDLLEGAGVTITFLPPTVIYRLLDIPGVTSRRFPALRYFMYGAAPMSVTRLRQALDTFGPVMTQCYGQTECHTMITVMRPEDHFINGEVAPDARLTSCGRPTIGTRIVIRDEQGREVAEGERGEICVKSDLAMSGYYRNPEATAEVMRDGLVCTGDIGVMDREGYLHIVDRKKDLIISGGFNVYPAEVENVLRAHPAVAECCVIGIPHPDWGEQVVAAVELKTGAAATEADLQAFARQRLGGVKAPKVVSIRASLPRSAVGKVLKKDVKAAWSEQTA